MKMYLAHFISADPEQPGDGVMPLMAESFDHALKQVRMFLALPQAPKVLLDGLVPLDSLHLPSEPDEEPEASEKAPKVPQQKKAAPVPAMSAGYL